MERNNITLLNESNFPTWKIQMKMHLIANELFDIVNGTEAEPTGDGEGVAVAARKDKALAAIVLGIQPRLLYLLDDPTDPIVV